MFIVCLSGMTWKFKRVKMLLLFVYLAGPGSLKERQKYCLLFVYLAGLVSSKGKKLFIVCLSGRARKFKKKAKTGLVFVYQAGYES